MVKQKEVLDVKNIEKQDLLKKYEKLTDISQSFQKQILFTTLPAQFDGDLIKKIEELLIYKNQKEQDLLIHHFLFEIVVKKYGFIPTKEMLAMKKVISKKIYNQIKTKQLNELKDCEICINSILKEIYIKQIVDQLKILNVKTYEQLLKMEYFFKNEKDVLKVIIQSQKEYIYRDIKNVFINSNSISNELIEQIVKKNKQDFKNLQTN